MPDLMRYCDSSHFDSLYADFTVFVTGKNPILPIEAAR